MECLLSPRKPAASKRRSDRQSRDDADSGHGSEDLLAAVIGVLHCPAFDTDVHLHGLSLETSFALKLGGRLGRAVCRICTTLQARPPLATPTSKHEVVRAEAVAVVRRGAGLERTGESRGRRMSAIADDRNRSEPAALAPPSGPAQASASRAKRSPVPALAGASIRGQAVVRRRVQQQQRILRRQSDTGLSPSGD